MVARHGNSDNTVKSPAQLLLRRGLPNRRVAILSAALALAVGVLATGSFVGEQRLCVARALDERARIAALEDEIDARRSAVLDALQRVRTAQDIRTAARYSGQDPPAGFAATRGKTTGDLTYERDQLRAGIVVEDPYGLRQRIQMTGPVDPWLLQNYPVDQFGYLYGASMNDLDSLRLAAKEELASYRADRALPAGKELEAVPHCSFLNTLRFTLFGSPHLLLRQQPI